MDYLFPKELFSMVGLRKMNFLCRHFSGNARFVIENLKSLEGTRALGNRLSKEASASLGLSPKIEIINLSMKTHYSFSSWCNLPPKLHSFTIDLFINEEGGTNGSLPYFLILSVLLN